MKLEVIYKLFRFKPVVAWVVCGILLGVSVAVHEYGFNLNLELVLLSLVPALLIQGIVAHAVNDLTDERVDRITDLKGTNRFKVLISGIASRKDLKILTFTVLIISTFIACYLFTKLGVLILLFYSVGLYAALAYSLSPLKLGWKPYAEWTVVFPVLVTLVVAINFIASGKLSFLAFVTGIIFALFNILWFLVSRLMDYEPDKKAGKITTFVKHGQDFYHLYIFSIMLLTFYILFFACIYVSNLFFVSVFVLCFALFIDDTGLSFRIDYNSTFLSVLRTRGIGLSIINSLALSIVFLIV